MTYKLPEPIPALKFQSAYTAEQMQAAYAAGLAARAPEGWKLVPIEPTKEMLNACIYENTASGFHSSTADLWNWEAMLAAAPEPKP